MINEKRLKKKYYDMRSDVRNREETEDRLVIRSPFIRRIISQLIINIVQKECKFSAKLKLKKLCITVTKSKVYVNLNLSGILNKADLINLTNVKFLKYVKLSIKNVPDFFKEIMAHKINSLIKNECGYEIELRVNEIIPSVSGSKVCVHLDADAMILKKDLMKLLNF